MRLNEDLSIEILIHEVEKLNSKEVVPLEREEFLKLKDSLLMDTYNFYPFFNMYLEVVNGKISSYWSTRIDQNDNFFPYKEYYYKKGGEVCGIEGLFIVKKCDKIVLSALANILIDRFSEVMIECSFACRRDVGYKNFLGMVVGWRAVGALIIVDFDTSFLTIKKERLFIEAAQHIKDDRVIRLLVKAYEIGVLVVDDEEDDEEDGQNVKFMRRSLEAIMPIPKVPKIGSVLFHFYLNSFDRVMEERFKELTYARHLNLTFIGVPLGVNYDQKVMEITKLIKFMDLTASARILVPGGPPAQEYFRYGLFLFYSHYEMSGLENKIKSVTKVRLRALCIEHEPNYSTHSRTHVRSIKCWALLLPLLVILEELLVSHNRLNESHSQNFCPSSNRT